MGGSSVLAVDYGYDEATGRFNKAEIDDTHAFHYSYRGGNGLSRLDRISQPDSPNVDGFKDLQ